MLKHFTLVAVSVLGTATTSAATLPEYKMQGPPPPILQDTPPYSIIKEEPTPMTLTATKEVVSDKPKQKLLVCRGCNNNENLTLEFFQKKGIVDKYALATIMGNIKQESKFIPNICEGGSRTSYSRCGGGYGIIQWTDSTRYRGLGRHASRLGTSPSEMETQLDYLINEPQWKSIEFHFKTPGKSLDNYMRLAYSWIGWGESGSRTHYARDYLNRLVYDS